MGEPWLTVGKLLAVVALVLANGFFVAAEFALVGVRRTRVEEMVEAGAAGARAVRRAHRNIDLFIAATQLGVTLSSLGLGWVGEPALGAIIERLLGLTPAPPVLAVVISFLVITYLLIVMGELVPKTATLQNPERMALLTIRPLTLFQLVFRPFILVLNASGRGVLRLLGLKAPHGHELVHSPDELRMLVEASGRAGVLEESEREIIGRVFDFADFAAHEVMVPRTEMAAVQADLTGLDLLAHVEQAGYSRYPVYDGSLDTILGIVHVKDLLATIRKGGLNEVTARDLAREPLLVPDTLGADAVLDRMRETNQRMAVVFDEFGGTAGIVTMENLFERLVGSLRDEFERAEEPVVEQNPDGTTEISGLTLINDVNEMFGLALDDAEYDTVGGYVFGQLGRVPEPGDMVEGPTYRLTVMQMDVRRVDRVLVEPRVDPTPTNPSDEDDEE